MEDLGHTPVLKSNDLQSLTDTLNMRMTEIEFENRFSSLFHEDLPVPLPKNVDTFVYPSIKTRSQKRKAPVPPKVKEPAGLINYQLQTLQELGPILAKSVTLPPNTSYKVKVKVKTQSLPKWPQHTTLTGYSSLVSVFKIRQTSSLKTRKKTLRKAIRRKNMSLGDLFSVMNSTKPASANPSSFCDGNCEPFCERCIIEENSECPSTNCIEEEGEGPQAGSELLPQPERSCISPLEIPLSELGVLSSLCGQRSSKEESDKSVVENSPLRTGLQSNSPSKQTSPRFNCSYEQGVSPCLLGSPKDTEKISSSAQDRPSHGPDTPSRSLGSPFRAYDSPSRACSSLSRASASSSRVRDSPVQGHCSSCNIHKSPLQVQISPSCFSSTPCHAPEDQPCVHSSPSSSRGSPSPMHQSPSQVNNSPSCVQNSPVCNRGRNTRMCGYPSWLQESLFEQSISMQNSPNGVLNSPSKNNEKAKLSDWSFTNDKLDELGNKIEEPCCMSYYKKKMSCDHIYEEVDESYLNLSGLNMGPYPPPVPSNSPCISPETLRHSGYLSDDKLNSGKKTAPLKPPRSRNKEVVLQKGSLVSENTPTVEGDNSNRRESLDDLDLEKIAGAESEKTVDISEILSDKDEQEKINETRKLKTYYYGEKFTPEHSSTRKSLPGQSKKMTSSPVSGPRSPGSPSFRAKKSQNKNSRRRFSIPKTFRFSLKTSLGNIRLSGKKFLTRSTRKDPQEKALSAYKSWQQKNSPAIVTPQNVRIPRIVIHVETPEACDSYDSPEMLEQIEDTNVHPEENALKQMSPPSPVPSVLSLLNTYEGCDLSIVGSQIDFYTPQSYLDGEEQEDCSEVEYLGATTSKSGFPSTCIPLHKESDDVICLESVKTKSKCHQQCLAHSQPDLPSLRSDDEEIIFLGASKCSRDKKRTSIKDTKLLKENPIYFHSYDDLQVILNSK